LPSFPDVLNSGSVAELRGVWDSRFAEPIDLPGGVKLATPESAVRNRSTILMGG
jgi:hypothetical protein